MMFLDLENCLFLFCGILLQGFKNQKSRYTLFRAPNNMLSNTIEHLTFCAPQIVICARMYTNVYLALHLLQKDKNILEQKVNLRSIPLTINPEPSLGVQTVFHRKRNNRQVSCLPRTTKPDNFPSTVFESSEQGRSFPVFVGLRQRGSYKHFNWGIKTMQEWRFCKYQLETFKYSHNSGNFKFFTTNLLCCHIFRPFPVRIWQIVV